MSLELNFVASSSEAAQQIGIIVIQAIQEELTGPRHGRWYPTSSNRYYDKDVYKTLPPSIKKEVNYHLKFVGARSRDEIYGAAYQASAPGEPPAVRTGRLRQSFNIFITMDSMHQYRCTIRSVVFYAGDLNYGTEKLDPRPFIEPAIEKCLPKIIAIQHQFLLHVVRGSSL